MREHVVHCITIMMIMTSTNVPMEYSDGNVIYSFDNIVFVVLDHAS